MKDLALSLPWFVWLMLAATLTCGFAFASNLARKIRPEVGHEVALAVMTCISAYMVASYAP